MTLADGINEMARLIRELCDDIRGRPSLAEIMRGEEEKYLQEREELREAGIKPGKYDDNFFGRKD